MKSTDRCILAVVALSDCQEVIAVIAVIPVGPLDAEKIAVAALLYVFTMAFPTSPFYDINADLNGNGFEKEYTGKLNFTYAINQGSICKS